jgi:DNA-binding transcriptional LysR family regulator
LQPTDNWFFRKSGAASEQWEEVPVTGPFRSDDSESLRSAALAGLGVVLLSTWLIGEDLQSGRLRRVLPDWGVRISPKPSGIFGVYPPHRMVPPKVKAFLGFAQKRFGKPPYWDPDWSDDPPRKAVDADDGGDRPPVRASGSP